MVFGDIPFTNDQEIVAGKLHMSKPVSKELEDLLRKMLSHRPADRPQIEKIEVHPWVLQDDFISRLALAVLRLFLTVDIFVRCLYLNNG